MRRGEESPAEDMFYPVGGCSEEIAETDIVQVGPKKRAENSPAEDMFYPVSIATLSC